MEAPSKSFESHGYVNPRAIGKGAYGTVYQVTSLRYQEDFCIKAVQHTPEAAREIELIRNLTHPNIIRMYDHWVEDDLMFIVFEYCPFGNLETLIKTEGRVHGIKFVKYAKQLLNAMDYCHSCNVAHRDIKPSNVLIDKWGRIKLSDFGLSSSTVDKETDTLVRGSLSYMAPEVLSKKRYIINKADIWSLGLTLYFMAAGFLPWPECGIDDLKKIISMGYVDYPSTMDNDIIKLLKSMLCYKPSSRKSAAEVLKSPFFTESEIRSTKSNTSFPHMINKCGSIASFSRVNSESTPALSQSTSREINENMKMCKLPNLIIMRKKTVNRKRISFPSMPNVPTFV